MNDLVARTKALALEIIKLTQSLPKDKINDVLGKQLLVLAQILSPSWGSSKKRLTR
jgi:hypothetical protein